MIQIISIASYCDHLASWYCDKPKAKASAIQRSSSLGVAWRNGTCLTLIIHAWLKVGVAHTLGEGHLPGNHADSLVSGQRPSNYGYFRFQESSNLPPPGITVPQVFILPQKQLKISSRQKSSTSWGKVGRLQHSECLKHENFAHSYQYWITIL